LSGTWELPNIWTQREARFRLDKKLQIVTRWQLWCSVVSQLRGAPCVCLVYRSRFIGAAYRCP